MNLTRYVDELADSLASVAATGDDATRRAASLLVAAMEPAARLAFMSALSDFAAEVSDSLDGTVVEVRLDGRDVTPVVSRLPQPDDEPTPSPPPSASSDGATEISRITLRLFEDLKNQAEEAAARQGMSLNAWLAQSVTDALRQGGRGKGSRVSGWVSG